MALRLKMTRGIIDKHRDAPRGENHEIPNSEIASVPVGTGMDPWERKQSFMLGVVGYFLKKIISPNGNDVPPIFTNKIKLGCALDDVFPSLGLEGLSASDLLVVDAGMSRHLTAEHDTPE